MFKKYSNLIEKLLSGLGQEVSDISINGYFRVVLNSIWLIITYTIVALGIAGILSAPYFIYEVWIVKMIQGKYEKINDRASKIRDESEELQAEYHKNYRSDLTRFEGYNEELRSKLREDRDILYDKLYKLDDEKDYSLIRKAYLMTLPLLLIYLALVTPLILIAIDMFLGGGAAITILIMASYFFLLTGFIVSSYSKTKRTESLGNKLL